MENEANRQATIVLIHHHSSSLPAALPVQDSLDAQIEEAAKRFRIQGDTNELSLCMDFGGIKAAMDQQCFEVVLTNSTAPIFYLIADNTPSGSGDGTAIAGQLIPSEIVKVPSTPATPLVRPVAAGPPNRHNPENSPPFEIRTPVAKKKRNAPTKAKADVKSKFAKFLRSQRSPSPDPVKILEQITKKRGRGQPAKVQAKSPAADPAPCLQVLLPRDSSSNTVVKVESADDDERMSEVEIDTKKTSKTAVKAKAKKAPKNANKGKPETKKPGKSLQIRPKARSPSTSDEGTASTTSFRPPGEGESSDESPAGSVVAAEEAESSEEIAKPLEFASGVNGNARPTISLMSQRSAIAHIAAGKMKHAKADADKPLGIDLEAIRTFFEDTLEPADPPTCVQQTALWQSYFDAVAPKWVEGLGQAFMAELLNHFPMAHAGHDPTAGFIVSNLKWRA